MRHFKSKVQVFVVVMRAGTDQGETGSSDEEKKQYEDFDFLVYHENLGSFLVSILF